MKSNVLLRSSSRLFGFKKFLNNYQEKQAYNETVEKCYRPLVKVCDDEQGEVGKKYQENKGINIENIQYKEKGGWSIGNI